LSKIHDPVFEEGKKEEKPVGKAAKKGDKPLEEEVKPVEEVIDYSHLLKGPREVSVIPLHYNLEQLYRTGLNVIPAPIYPDPNTLPVADPVYQQLVYKVRKGIMSPDGKY
jgi:hydrocephalus-inducing protein